MKLSIITPSFNQDKYIGTTIQSVLQQNYENTEYLIIDGGSSDQTINIIQAHENHIDYWVSEKDSGQSNAINKGFRKAKGDIVAWINSDDYYYPNIFHHVMKIFNDNPHIVLVYGNCTFTDEEGKFIRYFTEVQPYDPFILRNYSDYIMQPTTFFRKDALIKLGYLDESLHYGMDWDLWCKFATAYPDGICYLPELLAVNREYDNTKTKSGGDQRLKELRQINARHKTTKRHKAHLLYKGAEFHQKSKWPKIIKDKLVGALAISLGAASKLKQTRLYGFIPHSPFLEKEAHLIQPLYEVHQKKLQFRFQNPARREQEVAIEINGQVVYQKKLSGLQKDEITTAIPENLLLHATIHCRHEFSRNKVALKLLEFKFLD